MDIRPGHARGHAGGAPGVRSHRAGQSRQSHPRARLPGVDGSEEHSPVSDVIFGRLRALLGTTGVERDPQGVPRAIPDSPDALSLVCRLAHEEGWKIRVEGRGTWLAPVVPADLGVS